MNEQKKKDKNGNKVGTGKPTLSGLTNLSYAAVLRQALGVEGGEGFEGGERLYETGDADWARASGEAGLSEHVEPTPARRAPIQLATPAGGRGRSWVKTTPSEMHDAARVSAGDLLRLDRAGGMGYGTVMHALFEQVGYIEDGVPDDVTLLRAAESSRVEGVDVQQAIDAFKSSLEMPQVRALLQRDGADDLWRERRFMTRVEGGLVNGVFDRVHLWAEGGKPTRAVLIDFKTDRVDDDSVAAKAEAYADQLRLYRAALSAMLGLDADAIETRLCFVGDGRVVGV